MVFVWVWGGQTKFRSIAIEAADSRFQTNETPSLNCSTPGSDNSSRLCTWNGPWNGSRSSKSVFRTLWAQVPQVPQFTRNGGSRPGTAARGPFLGPFRRRARERGKKRVPYNPFRDRGTRSWSSKPLKRRFSSRIETPKLSPLPRGPWSKTEAEVDGTL